MDKFLHWSESVTKKESSNDMEGAHHTRHDLNVARPYFKTMSNTNY